MQTHNAINRQQEAKRVRLLPAHVQVPAHARQSSRIPFHISRGVVYVNPADVTHVQAQSNYARIFFRSGKTLLVSKTLKYCAGVLPVYFLRIHQSYLINPDFLEFYSNADKTVELGGGVFLPVSRSGRKSILMNL